MRYVNAQQAADFYAMTPKTLRRLARRGEVQAVKVGGRWRFLVSVLGGAA